MEIELTPDVLIRALTQNGFYCGSHTMDEKKKIQFETRNVPLACAILTDILLSKFGVPMSRIERLFAEAKLFHSVNDFEYFEYMIVFETMEYPEKWHDPPRIYHRRGNEGDRGLWN